MPAIQLSQTHSNKNTKASKKLGTRCVSSQASREAGCQFADFSIFCSFPGLDGCFQNLTGFRGKLLALQSLSDGRTAELLCSIPPGEGDGAGQCRSPSPRGRLLRMPRLMARRALEGFSSRDRPTAVPCVPWHCFVPWHRRWLCPPGPCDSSTIVGWLPRAACDAPHRHLLPCASPSAARIRSCFLQEAQGPKAAL